MLTLSTMQLQLDMLEEENENILNKVMQSYSFASIACRIPIQVELY